MKKKVKSRRRPASVSRGDQLAKMSRLKQTPSNQLVSFQFPYKTQKISLSSSSTFTLLDDVDAMSDVLTNDHVTVMQKFQEWRIVKVMYRFTPLSSTGGASLFGITEDVASTTINSTTVKNLDYRVFQNNNSQPQINNILTWTPADYATLEFTPTSTTTTLPIYNLYGFTNSTDFGTPSSTTDLWLVTGLITIEARGFSGQ